MLPYLNPQCLSGKSFYGQQEASLPLSNPANALSPLTTYDIDLFAAHFLAPDWPGVLDTPDLAPEGSKEANAAAAPPTRKGGQRKRRSRTDRHSKITTAQGVRDRRMRLSLDVAGKFFALQDVLGFDKASQTVDWLLTQSKPAIKRLINESSNNNNNKTLEKYESCTSEWGDLISATSLAASRKGKVDKAVSKAAVDLNLSKGLREKARARARERTQEKRRMMSNGMGNGCKIYQMAPAEAENIVKEGDCFNGDKNECSPMAVVPSCVICKNGKVDYFTNGLMNKGFTGNIEEEEEEEEGNSFGNMQFQDSSWDDYSMLSF